MKNEELYNFCDTRDGRFGPVAITLLGIATAGIGACVLLLLEHFWRNEKLDNGEMRSLLGQLQSDAERAKVRELYDARGGVLLRRDLGTLKNFVVEADNAALKAEVQEALNTERVAASTSAAGPAFT